MVVTLTFVGCLNEIMYFSVFLLGMEVVSGYMFGGMHHAPCGIGLSTTKSTFGVLSGSHSIVRCCSRLCGSSRQCN
jgi:hypothetical protein